ncbi:MAG: hypothetical protein LPK45_11710, partial [Bacteroidota bacterium]|nr:hypothetical protein [Bacteroidota bacterium]MDX5431775.1 hypothetical protein [Bacteroidota bacterium]MDX5470488.1 hypothetical protein [Bacteroidota bacterium]
MKLISEQIRALLHEHDCVVVPGLGGFILNHLPATYNEKEHRFFPERALPFFNKQLQSNDGLLAAALVKHKSFDYSSAISEINRFVDQVKETIQDNRTYAMPGLGEFQQNHEGQITFYPDAGTNVDADSFGLDALQLTPINKAKNVQRKALAPIRKKSRSWIGVAASLAIIAFGGWFVSEGVNTPFGKQWSALNPF